MTYRIRWARIDVVGRHHVYLERRCIAERRTRLFGLIPIWLPLPNGNWRHTEEAAQNDIDRGRQLYSPLPETKVIP